MLWQKDRKTGRSRKEPKIGGDRRAELLDDDGRADWRLGVTLKTYHPERVDETERQHVKRLRAFRRRLSAVLMLIALFVTMGMLLLSQFTGAISRVVAADDNIRLTDGDAARYRQIVDEYLHRNSSERLSFIRRSSALTGYLQSKAPEVETVKLTTAGLASSKMVLSFRQPVAMWVNGTHTSFVDKSGVVFQRNYYSIPELAIEDQSGVGVSSGNVATSAGFLSFVGRTAVAIAQNQGLKAVRVVIPRGSIRYVEIYLAGRAYPFKAQITREPEGQAADIATMVRYLDGRGIRPSYVDCRVEGRAYWK